MKAGIPKPLTTADLAAAAATPQADDEGVVRHGPQLRALCQPGRDVRRHSEVPEAGMKHERPLPARRRCSSSSGGIADADRRIAAATGRRSRGSADAWPIGPLPGRGREATTRRRTRPAGDPLCAGASVRALRSGPDHAAAEPLRRGCGGIMEAIRLQSLRGRLLRHPGQLAPASQPLARAPWPPPTGVGDRAGASAVHEPAGAGAGEARRPRGSRGDDAPGARPPARTTPTPTPTKAGPSCTQGNPLKAMEHFREALRLDPEMEWARAGIVEAMKARNFVYRWMLAYFLWMARLDSRVRWGLVIGAPGGEQPHLAAGGGRTPALAPLLLPILFAYFALRADVVAGLSALQSAPAARPLWPLRPVARSGEGANVLVVCVGDHARLPGRGDCHWSSRAL